MITAHRTVDRTISNPVHADARQGRKTLNYVFSLHKYNLKVGIKVVHYCKHLWGQQCCEISLDLQLRTDDAQIPLQVSGKVLPIP